MSLIAVTGASGFVGRALMKRLAGSPYEALAFVREVDPGKIGRQKHMPDLACLAAGEAHVDLSGIDTLVHCAAIPQSARTMTETQRAHLYAVNASATAALARQALADGVRRFILISSAKVNGETTAPGKAFGADDVPSPKDAYAKSKLAAERSLVGITGQTRMDTVIVRPPLVYGPGIKGNFSQLIQLSARGLPLPFGAVRNKRSMVFVGNLADLIAAAIDRPQAAGRILMASDGEDLSTGELIRRLARLQGAPDRLFSISPALLANVLVVLGQNGIANRLLHSFQVDSRPTANLLEWTPPFNVDQALHATILGLS